MDRGKPWRLRALVALLATPVLFGCSDGGTLPGREDPVKPSVRIAANLGGTQVTAVVVEVTAADIPVALTFNLAVTEGVATGTLTVPAGSGRTITVRAFDAKAVETHRGSATVAVSEGTNPTVSIQLAPLLGGLPIQVQVGSRVIVVTPADSAVTAGDTLRFTARVQDAAGNTVPAAVRWTTSNPVLAPIDSAGLVTAAREGAVEVVATHQGVAAHARLAIRPRAARAGFAARSVVAGGSHSCALTPAGAAYCWGANQWGQLGRGTTSPAGTATPDPAPVAGGHTFTALSAAGEQTCGLTAAGAALCWGYNGQGQLGDGTTEHRSAPVAVAGGHVFTQLSTGWGFACGLAGDGAAHCWGRNPNGELGAATTTTCLNGTTVMNCSRTPVRVSGAARFARIDAGFWSACGLTSAGAAYCWGDNSYGQLGDGTFNRASAPVPVKGGHSFARISVGSVRTCAIDTQQGAYCWGSDLGGGLGTGPVPSSGTPVPVLGSLRFASIEVSTENNVLAHACAVTAEGAAYCWGTNETGELGSLPGTETCTFSGVARACASAPTRVAGGLVFRAVTPGLSHTCGVTVDDVPYCWGANGAGQAGRNAGTASYTPQRVTAE